MSSPIMKIFTLLLLTALATAQFSTSGSMNMSMSGISMNATSTSASPEYTITALPAVITQPPCIFNCLVPIGLADPSHCNDVTEDCACLSAPADVLDVLSSCIETVCKSSATAYAAIATSLYESYCNSVYGTAVFTSAFSAEAAAAASSSNASAQMTASSTASSGAAKSGSPTSLSASPSASSTAKSESVSWVPSLFIVTLTLGGLTFLIVL